MDKPWDALREQVSLPPTKPGSFGLTCNSKTPKKRIRLIRYNQYEAVFKLGFARMEIAFDPIELECFAGFINALLVDMKTHASYPAYEEDSVLEDEDDKEGEDDSV